MEEKSPLVWIFAIIISIILGAAGGYYYGSKIGYDKGLTDAAKISAESPAIKVDTGYKNPFEDVNLNPFKK